MRSVPLAEVASALDGRTRLRFAAYRGDTGFFAGLAERLGRLAGVSQVASRPATGSVLVAHEGPAADFLERAAAAGLFAVGASRLPAVAIVPPAAAAALAFGALGVMQLFQNRIFPPAITLFWYAATLAKEIRAGSGADAED